MTTTEWLLYNILELKFIQGKRVRDVAMRLAMSESDLYRKQRIAIEKVANYIAEMERQAQSIPSSEAPPYPAQDRDHTLSPLHGTEDVPRLLDSD